MQIKVYTIDIQLPRLLKRGVLFVGIPLLGLFGIAAAVRAAVPEGFPLPIAPDYSKGDLLTADSLNTKFNDLRKAANTLATSIDSLQVADSTVQGQISALGTKLDSAKVALTVRGLEQNTTTLAANSVSGWYQSKDCTAEEILVGGGCFTKTIPDGSSATNAAITTSYAEGTHWMCAFRNNGSATVTIHATAVCAKAALAF